MPLERSGGFHAPPSYRGSDSERRRAGYTTSTAGSMGTDRHNKNFPYVRDPRQEPMASTAVMRLLGHVAGQPFTASAQPSIRPSVQPSIRSLGDGCLAPLKPRLNVVDVSDTETAATHLRERIGHLA